MKKRLIIFLSLFTIHYSLFTAPFLLVACAKHDPILPGVRTDVFDTGNAAIVNQPIPDGVLQMPLAAAQSESSAVSYIQDSDNIVWSVAPDGTKTRIFSGLATTSRVGGTRTPVAAGGFVYAGLSTGELVKINPKTRAPVWIADVYKPAAFTGGAPIMDIVAPIQIVGDAVFAGGIGDAFCKMTAQSGKIVWCADVGTGVPFILAGGAAFVSGTDNTLYAINLKDGTIWWTATTKVQAAPILTQTSDGVYHISVGKEKFVATTGAAEKIKS